MQKHNENAHIKGDHLMWVIPQGTTLDLRDCSIH